MRGFQEMGRSSRGDQKGAWAVSCGDQTLREERDLRALGLVGWTSAEIRATIGSVLGVARQIMRTLLGEPWNPAQGWSHSGQGPLLDTA